MPSTADHAQWFTLAISRRAGSWTQTAGCRPEQVKHLWNERMNLQLFSFVSCMRSKAVVLYSYKLRLDAAAEVVQQIHRSNNQQSNGKWSSYRK